MADNCPHCATKLPLVRDACCPQCGESLDEVPAQRAAGSAAPALPPPARPSSAQELIGKQLTTAWGLGLRVWPDGGDGFPRARVDHAAVIGRGYVAVAGVVAASAITWGYARWKRKASAERPPTDPRASPPSGR